MDTLWQTLPINIACVSPSDPNSELVDNFPLMSSLGGHESVGAIPTPDQGCLYNSSTQVSVTHSQQNFIIQVPTKNDEVRSCGRWSGVGEDSDGVPANLIATGSVATVVTICGHVLLVTVTIVSGWCCRRRLRRCQVLYVYTGDRWQQAPDGIKVGQPGLAACLLSPGLKLTCQLPVAWREVEQ